MRINLRAHIKSTRTPFHIDLGIGDVIIPNPEPRFGACQSNSELVISTTISLLLSEV